MQAQCVILLLKYTSFQRYLCFSSIFPRIQILRSLERYFKYSIVFKLQYLFLIPQRNKISPLISETWEYTWAPMLYVASVLHRWDCWEAASYHSIYPSGFFTGVNWFARCCEVCFLLFVLLLFLLINYIAGFPFFLMALL